MVTTMNIVLGALLTSLSIINIVLTLKDRVAKPEVEQNEKIAALQEEINQFKTFIKDKFKEIDLRQDKSDDRIIILEQTQRVTLKSLGALLSHGINGNNTTEMQEAKKELDAFIISR